jgi:hypothetical protein
MCAPLSNVVLTLHPGGLVSFSHRTLPAVIAAWKPD